MSKVGNPSLLEGEYIEEPKTGKKKLMAAVALGSRKSEAKAAASREHGRKSSPGPGEMLVFLSGGPRTPAPKDAEEARQRRVAMAQMNARLREWLR